MSEKWKTLLLDIGKAVGILIMGGIAVFLAALYGLFALPLYVTKIIPVAGFSILLALVVITSGYLNKKWRRRVGILLACILLGCVGFAGYGAYKDAIPTLDERTYLLYQYEPYTAGSKAVTLDEPSTLKFDAETAQGIRLDGATALYPIYASFVRNVWPTTGVELRLWQEDTTLACSGTIDAYTNLVYGKADMIFAAAPSQAQVDAARSAGMEFHLTPIGREAFVFFVNSKNPVDSLTVEEVQGIYTGTITNWKEVGGKNQSIRPFQRAENSGSQSALLRLMEGLPLMEPEEEDRIDGMGGIINEVASYRNYKNAIGFSFRYYSTEMVQNGDIKLLALNGAKPTRETIRNGSYPTASEFYAITASPIGQPAPEESDEDLAALLDWILSEQGQRLIEEVGYVSLYG